MSHCRPASAQLDSGSWAALEVFRQNQTNVCQAANGTGTNLSFKPASCACTLLPQPERRGRRAARQALLGALSIQFGVQCVRPAGDHSAAAQFMRGAADRDDVWRRLWPGETFVSTRRSTGTRATLEGPPCTSQRLAFVVSPSLTELSY